MDTISHQLSENADPNKDEVLEAVERIVDANQTLKQQLAQANATIQQQAETIGTHLVSSLTDPLLGIANRRAFDQELRRQLAEFQRRRIPFSLILCDVDCFKQLNDTYGHVAGDQALQQLAARIASSLRKVDLAARYGGEEFGILLPHTTANQGMIVMERIRRAICEVPFTVDGRQLVVTASFGLTQSLGQEQDEVSIIKRADEALYASKQSGRNCGHFHNGNICRLVQPSAAPAAAERNPSRPTSPKRSRRSVPNAMLARIWAPTPPAPMPSRDFPRGNCSKRNSKNTCRRRGQASPPLPSCCWRWLTATTMASLLPVRTRSGRSRRP